MLKFADEKALIKFITTAKLPEWRNRMFKRHSEAIQVHSQGELFYKLDALFPNEHPDSKKHRILAFESITEASFDRAANNVNRIFKNSSYTVEASEKTLQALAAHNFEDQNFYIWFLDKWVEWALKQDANALIAFYPPEYYTRENKLPAAFIASEHIRYVSEDAVVFVSEEESVVDYEIKEVRVQSKPFYDQSINRVNIMEARENTFTPKLEANIKKYVYHAFLNGLGFYRIEQLEKVKDGIEYEFEFFPIKKAFIPVTDTGGEKGKQNINKSFLHPFVTFGNLALLQHSQHTAVNFTFSFPRMSEVETPCQAVGCSLGFIQCETPEDLATYPDGKKPCKVCGGTGSVVNQTPYKVYRKRYDPNGMDGDNDHLTVPDVQFYTPDTAILDYSKEEWKNYLEMAETAVYIQQRIKTGNVEAAKSKEIDREDLYSFLARVGQVYFSKLRFAVQCFENYLIGNPVEVSVAVPYSYAILSEGEAFEALQTILTSNVPVMLKANQVESFINKFVSASSPIKKFLEVLKLVDPLLYYSGQELTGFKLAGAVNPEQFVIHVYAYPVLQRLYYEDKTIFLQDARQIAQKLLKELEAFKPEPVEDLRTRIQNQMSE